MTHKLGLKGKVELGVLFTDGASTPSVLPRSTLQGWKTTREDGGTSVERHFLQRRDMTWMGVQQPEECDTSSAGFHGHIHTVDTCHDGGDTPHHCEG